MSSPLLPLAARRAELQKVAPWLAFAAGMLAAPGLLLKPYFLLAPLVLEAWLAFRAKRVVVKPENVALGAAGLLYAVTIPLFAPAYLSVMVPLVRTAYHGYNSTILGLVLGPHVMAPLLLMGGLLWASQERRSTFLTATVIAGSGFLLAGLWQHKGFTYHFIPALGCGFIGLGLIAVDLRTARAPARVCLLAALVLVGVTLSRESGRGDGFAVAATADLPNGSTILMLSESGSAAWPLAGEREFVWPSRHMAHWMLAAVWMARAEGRPDPVLERFGREVVVEAAEDIARSRPAMILFDRRGDAASGGVVGFLEAEPRFAAAMRGYQRKADVGYLAVYQRRKP